MTYAEVYSVINEYAVEILPIFAIGWGRFPLCECKRDRIVGYLNRRSTHYWDIGEDNAAAEVTKAVTEIMFQCKFERR